MNFEIHKRVIMGTVGAILVLALMAGGAYAGPGKGKGPRYSVNVMNICSISNNQLTIDTTVKKDFDSEIPGNIVPTSSTVVVTGYGRGREPLGTQIEQDYVIGEQINLCPSLDGAKKIKVGITFQFDVDGDMRSFTSSCDDDPSNNYYEEGELVYIEDLDESNLDKYMPVSC